MDVLLGEVRWGYAEGAGYVHGIMIRNISKEQGDFLVQYLCEYAFTRQAANPADQEAS